MESGAQLHSYLYIRGPQRMNHVDCNDPQTATRSRLTEITAAKHQYIKLVTDIHHQPPLSIQS